MRVAFFTHYSEPYGANRSLLGLIDGLARQGVESFVVVPLQGALTRSLDERSIPYSIIPHQWWSSVRPAGGGISAYARWRRESFARLRTNVRLIPEITNKLNEWKIDIVYTNSSVIPVGAMVASWMKKPHVWHLREFGTQDYGLTPDWGESVFNFFLKQASAQICVSDAIRIRYQYGLVNGKHHVVHNGVLFGEEMDRLRNAAVLRKDVREQFVFALVGLIHPQKGQETAVGAVSLLKDSFPNIRLIIAGGGNPDHLKALAARRGISDRVQFHDYVDNPYDIYLQSDATLMCSRHEAMGRVTVEAMAAGKPVIGYNGGGTPELIQDGINGLIYEGGEDELASCMRRLAENHVSAREMGEIGWKIARQKYTIEAYASSIYDIMSALH